jgi:hypothetical protein
MSSKVRSQARASLEQGLEEIRREYLGRQKSREGILLFKLRGCLSKGTRVFEVAQNLTPCYTKPMQKIATRVFIYSSIAFGILGLLVVFTIPNNGDANTSTAHIFLMKLMLATVFFILPSFALSIAGKYLGDKS